MITLILDGSIVFQANEKCNGNIIINKIKNKNRNSHFHLNWLNQKYDWEEEKNKNKNREKRHNINSHICLSRLC